MIRSKIISPFAHRSVIVRLKNCLKNQTTFFTSLSKKVQASLTFSRSFSTIFPRNSLVCLNLVSCFALLFLRPILSKSNNSHSKFLFNSEQNENLKSQSWSKTRGVLLRPSPNYRSCRK